MNQAISNLTKGDPVRLALGAAIVLAAVYFLTRKAVTDTVNAATDAVGGVLSGNNSVTQGTVYEGQGILGTAGAAANAVSGGTLEEFGSWLGGAIYDIFHADYDPNRPSKAARLTARSDADGRPTILR